MVIPEGKKEMVDGPYHRFSFDGWRFACIY
jgi:hypothetical protein